jgi:hypothetical protein
MACGAEEGRAGRANPRVAPGGNYALENAVDHTELTTAFESAVDHTELTTASRARWITRN